MLQMKLSELASTWGSSYPLDHLFQTVAIDSRKVEKGALFFALPGERVDGHHFLEMAAKRGAVGAVVSKSYVGSNFGLPLLYVDSPISALQSFAREILARRNPKIVAITGSVGKTTTKEFLYTLLQPHFCVGKSPDSCNSQVGLPCAILNARGDEDLLILEMAMSEKGNLSNLIKIAPPDIAVITKIDLQHAEFFQDLEEIAKAKAEILLSPRLSAVICHRQALSFPSINEGGKAKKTSFSLGEEGADFSLVGEGSDVTIKEKGGGEKLFHLSFEAKHLQENFLAAAAVARFLGLSWEDLEQSQSQLRPFKRRFESMRVGGAHVINDSYNMSPASVLCALQNLPKPLQGGKTIAVIGEFKELGKFEKQSYQAVAKEALPLVDHLLCYGRDAKPLFHIFEREQKCAEWFDDKQKLRERLLSLMTEKDVVLVKGGNTNRLWEVVE